MKTEDLKLLRDILFRTAIIYFAFSIVMALSTIFLWDTWSGLTCQWYHVKPEDIGATILNFFAAVKFFFVFIILVPALALHWTIKASTRLAVDKNG